MINFNKARNGLQKYTLTLSLKILSLIGRGGGGGTQIDLFPQYLNVFRILDFTDNSVCIITDK